MASNPRKVVFLDRDGVINRDSPEYIKSWSEFEFLPGSLEALRLLHDEGYLIILVTNQSGVARKLFSVQTLDDMHRRMEAAIETAGGKITDIFYCPHLPDEGCDCRKPETAMIENAVRKHGLDLLSGTLVGDSAKDIICGQRAGVGLTILVRTGNGPAAEIELADRKSAPDHVAADLLAAAHWLIDPRNHLPPS